MTTNVFNPEAAAQIKISNPDLYTMAVLPNLKAAQVKQVDALVESVIAAQMEAERKASKVMGIRQVKDQMDVDGTDAENIWSAMADLVDALISNGAKVATSEKGWTGISTGRFGSIPVPGGTLKVTYTIK